MKCFILQTKSKDDKNILSPHMRTTDMSKQAAEDAMENGTKVAAGSGSDRDTWIIRSISGNMAEVGWSSGVNTKINISELSKA